MNRSKSKRKQRFIDRKVQGALISQVVRHWLLFFFGVFMLLACLQALFGESNETFMDHFGAVWGRYSLFFIVALSLIPALINETIKLSHRFVGPVLRVRENLRRLAAGKSVEPMTLRKSDFWHTLADDFNAALATIERSKTSPDETDSNVDDKPAENREPELVGS